MNETQRVRSQTIEEERNSIIIEKELETRYKLQSLNLYVELLKHGDKEVTEHNFDKVLELIKECQALVNEALFMKYDI